MTQTESAILAHARRCAPAESCGFVVSTPEGERYFPCVNISGEPEAYFRMSPEDWLQAEMQGEIVALVHSHPGGLPWLSEADRRLQVQSDLPWWLVCRGTIHKFRCVPHLTGRRFEHGVTDCYTLFRDAYHLAGIEMPDFHREDDWWRNGQNLYLDNLEATGLYQVPLSAAQPGDVLLCCFGSSVPNHAAIYCGDGELLHHIPEQLSKRERYTDKWQRRTVPDGFGGTEPRITCNAYLTTQRKAWDVLSDFCSAMRCMPVWNGQTLTFVQDRPSDKVWTYNRSNVVMPDDGAPFRYSFSALKDRHNAVEVNWIDPNNGWETATELVEDTQAIARYGRNVTKMDAFGCTSRGQAHRAGLWLIKTELLETQTVDFSVGAEGLRHVPGDVIEICDDDYAGISIGGRVLAVNSQTRTLTLDREITLPSSGTTLILVLIRTPLRLAHMDTPSPLTLLVTRKTPSKTSHLTIL